MERALINVVENFQRIDLIGVNHFYYEFNKDSKSGEVLLFLNLHEHYNNLELFKVSLFCRRHNLRLVAYGHLNELPLFSTFADAAIMYSRDDHEIYDGISRYVYDHGLVGGIFNESLSHAVRQCWSLGRVAGKKPLLLEIIEKEISDDEVVKEFAFTKICIRKQAYAKYQILKSIGLIKSDTIVCEVKNAHDCGGPHLLNTLREASKDFELNIELDIEFNKKMFGLCGQDYMSVQVLASFLDNWMWILYGGSCNIFPFFPVKILSMADQTILPELTRKMSIERFGEIGKIFPEFETLVYCLPGEGAKDSAGNDLPDIRQSIKDFSMQQNNFILNHHD
jgi:hypothetical protein